MNNSIIKKISNTPIKQSIYKLVVLLLSIIVLITTIVVNTIYTNASSHTHSTGESFNTTLDVTSGTLDSGDYILNSDLNLSGDITIEDYFTVNLCLNGNTLDLNNHKIIVSGNAELNIYDCGFGKITSNNPEDMTDAFIHNNGSLTLNNVTCTGLKTVEKSPILSLGELTINNSTFTGNSGVYGGAIAIYYDATIVGSKFENNDATNGGAIYIGSGADNNDTDVKTISISKSEFKNNNATIGGAIYRAASVLTLEDTTITDNVATQNAGGIYADKNKKYSTNAGVSDEEAEACFAEGTKITMGDGTVNNIEDITEGDTILTYNHHTGEWTPQMVYLAWEGDNTSDHVLHLTFSNDITLDIIGQHDLFEQESMKYVTISENNYEQYVGKHFYNATDKCWESLDSASIVDKEVHYYSIYTAMDFNCIAQGMLSVPDDADYQLNIFTFNEDLTVNQEQLQYDIDTYGLYTTEGSDYLSKEEYDRYGLSDEEFEMLQLKYINLMIGKGLITKEVLFAAYDEIFEENETASISSDLELLNSVSTTSDDSSDYHIVIGSNVIIKDNYVKETPVNNISNQYESNIGINYHNDDATDNIIRLVTGIKSSDVGVYINNIRNNRKYEIKSIILGEISDDTTTLSCLHSDKWDYGLILNDKEITVVNRQV